MAPPLGDYFNTLGVAQYRARNWQAAIEAFNESMKLRNGGDASDWFFSAMTHWQLGQKDDARKSYEKAVELMNKNAPKNEELIRFRAEAAELLRTTNPKPSANKQTVDDAPPTSTGNRPKDN